jgi:long-chain fatty acid transport protein
MSNIRRLSGIVICVLAAGRAGATNGYFLSGYGTNSKAEAGVGIALPQDALTVATNPAGLGDIADSVSVGLEIFSPSRGASLVQGGQTEDFNGNGVGKFYLPELGFNQRLGDRVSWGVALYGNGGLDTDYLSDPYARFAPPGSNVASGTAGVNLQQAFLTPAVAFEVNDSNSIGLALNVAYQRFEAEGVGLFAGFSADPADVSNRGFDHSFGAGVRLGWLGHFGDFVTLGATWQSKTYMGRFTKYAGLFADQGGFDVPDTYGLGITLRPTPDWTLSLDWQRILYSHVASVGDPVNALFQGVPLGAAGGPGFGWQNVSVIKVGGSYQVTKAVSLRAGYSHSQQPVPTSQTFFNILAPGVIQDHVAAGVSWNLANGNELSLAYIHAFENTVNGSGSIPPAFGGGEANIHLEENSLAISFLHRLK